MKQKHFGWIVYAVAVALIVASFCLPPVGVVDNSVITAAGVMLGGYQLLFGRGVKDIHIDKTGVHITATEKK